MRAFLSSAFERFFSLFVYAHELLTYDPGRSITHTDGVHT